MWESMNFYISALVKCTLLLALSLLGLENKQIDAQNNKFFNHL